MFGSNGLLVVCNTEVETHVFVDLEAAGRQKGFLLYPNLGL